MDEVDVLEEVDNDAVDAIISLSEFIVVVVGWFTRGRFVAGLFKDMLTIPEEEDEDEETGDDAVEVVAAGAERFWPIKLCDLLSSLDVAAGNDDFETAKDIIVILFGFLLSKAKGKGEDRVFWFAVGDINLFPNLISPTRHIPYEVSYKVRYTDI